MDPPDPSVIPVPVVGAIVRFPPELIVIGPVLVTASVPGVVTVTPEFIILVSAFPGTAPRSQTAVEFQNPDDVAVYVNA